MTHGMEGRQQSLQSHNDGYEIKRMKMIWTSPEPVFPPLTTMAEGAETLSGELQAKLHAHKVQKTSLLPFHTP